MDRTDDNDLAHVLRLGLKPIASQPCPWGGNGGINPHLTRFTLADGRVADVFHVKPVYYETPQGHWRPLSEISEHHGNRRIILRVDAWGKLSLRYLRWLMARQRLLGSALEFAGLVSPERLEFADTLTAYPDPNPETTTVDGYVVHSNASWATAQGAATGTTAIDSSSSLYAGSSQLSSYQLIRAFCLFDTSGLPDDATDVSGVLSLYAVTKTNGDNDGDDWINVVQSNPASNTGLATADYDQCGDAIDNPTEGATRIDLGSITTSAYNDWTLNSTGNGWISLTGVTKLGFREGHDCIDSAIATSADNELRTRSADQTGTSLDPKLVVTYTPGGVTEEGAASWSGVGTMTAALSQTHSGAAAWSGAGSWTADGLRGQLGAATWAGAGAWAAAGALTGRGTAAWSGAGSWAAAAVYTARAAGSWAGAGSWSAAGLRTQYGAALWAGTGSWAGVGKLTARASVAWSGAGTMTATGGVVQLASATFAGVGTMTARGLRVFLAVGKSAGQTVSGWIGQSAAQSGAWIGKDAS